MSFVLNLTLFFIKFLLLIFSQKVVKMHIQEKSHKLYEKLCEAIPGGVNSPVRACKGLLDVPFIAHRGEGDKIYDVNGSEFIDYCGSWGSLIHGHAHPQILEAVIKRISLGTSFGASTEIEEQLANQIINIIPSIEKIRFVSSGTEATMSAVRLARGFTKRKLIVKFNGNYHGHADFFLVNAGSGVFNLNSSSSSEGIPEEIIKNTLSIPYNDIDIISEVFEKYGHEIAAVILEPIAGNMGLIPSDKNFLEFLRKETKNKGILLIFDEVISGFRVGKKGAQGLYGIEPDLTCLGKIIGGGFPAAAFGGKNEIMNCLAPLGKVYQAGTLSGNPVAMEAGFQALKLLEKQNFYEELEKKTNLITLPIKNFIEKNNLNLALSQIGSMFTLFFGKKIIKNDEDVRNLDLDSFKKFFRYLYERGIYIPPSQYETWFVSSVHEEKNLIKTKDIILEFLNIYKKEFI